MFSALILSVAVAAQPGAPTWPQWRGPTRDGVVSKGVAWPSNFSDKTFTKAWEVKELGPSYSGPIVSEDLVFTTETVGKQKEVVTAFERKTGKKAWEHAWMGSITVPFFAAQNGSWIRSTPAYADGKLFVGGIKDVLVCLDAKTGSQVWKLDFVEEMKSAVPTFGFVCSPLVDETGVYVQAGASFVKVDKNSGKVIWSTLKDAGGMNGSAFSSPVFATVAGQDQILVQTRTTLAGINRKDGAILWKKEIPSFRGMNILTPVPFEKDGVFTSTYGSTTQLFRVQADGKSFSTTKGWEFKYEGYMTSPVVVNDFAYLLGKDQRVICVDLKTGKETWRSEKRFGQYWSIVANGDKLLALDQKGMLYLLKANPKEFEILAEKRVADSESWAHIAVCGSEVIIRDLNKLTAWKWVEPNN
jgi:outer membrane protein assembly factor BamB